MRRTKPKDKSVKKHFIRRFKERFGIDITENSYNDIIGQIKNPDVYTFVLSQSVSRKIHKVTLEDKEYLVVYNPIKKILHTVLPEGATGEEIERIRDDVTVSISGQLYHGYSNTEEGNNETEV